MINFLSFYLSEKLYISPSHLKDNLSGLEFSDFFFFNIKYFTPVNFYLCTFVLEVYFNLHSSSLSGKLYFLSGFLQEFLFSLVFYSLNMICLSIYGFGV